MDTDDYINGYHAGAHDVLHALAHLARNAPSGAYCIPHRVRYRRASAHVSLFIDCPLDTALAHFDESPTMDDSDPGGVILTWADPSGAYVGMWSRDEVTAAGLVLGGGE